MANTDLSFLSDLHSATKISEYGFVRASSSRRSDLQSLRRTLGSLQIDYFEATNECCRNKANMKHGCLEDVTCGYSLPPLRRHSNSVVRQRLAVSKLHSASQTCSEYPLTDCFMF